MATREEEQMWQPRSIGGAMGGTLGSNLQLGGFGNPMGFTPPNPPSVFGASTQQSSQDFSRLQVPPTPSIPLGNTVPVFPDNYNRVIGERMRASSSMVSGIREGDLSGFSPYSQTVPSMGGLTQTPSMAPTTNAITSFGNPMASRTERIETPYGTATTTLNPEQQAFRFQARQQAEQTGTMPRTPQQQQTLLENIRKNAPALNQQRTDWVQNTIQQRRENPTTYTTPSGKNVAVPTNRFGEPIKAWMDQLGGGGRLNYGPSPSPQTASAASSQPSQGVRFSPTPSRPIPMPVVDSAGQRIGVTSDFPTSGGGPQPASPMLTGNSMVGRTRKRLFGTV